MNTLTDLEIIIEVQKAIAHMDKNKLKKYEFNHKISTSVVNLLEGYNFEVIQQGTNVLIIDNQ